VFKIIRIPSVLEPFFGSLTSKFHWEHFDYFRMLVLSVAVAWGRRNVSNLYRHLDADTHRTRFNNFILVQRWDAPACLRLKAEELVGSLHPRPGDTLYLLLDDSMKVKRGKAMEAVGYLHDSATGTKRPGHQYVTAVIQFQGLIIPLGVRLYVKKEHSRGVGVPFRKSTQLAADLIREFNAPAGVSVVVLFDSFYLCKTVVKACREKGFHYASALKQNRNLFRDGRKLKAGRYARKLRRSKAERHITISGEKDKTVYSLIDAGRMNVGDLGPHRVVFSRKGQDRHQLGLVTDDLRMKADDLVRTYAKRWSIEVFFKDVKQLLGLGQYQNGTYGAAVTHLHLVCFAYALLTHLRIEGEKGKRTRTQAARRSVSEVQNELRRVVWRDLVAYLEEQPSGTSFVKELERLLVA